MRTPASKTIDPLTEFYRFLLSEAKRLNITIDDLQKPADSVIPVTATIPLPDKGIK